LKPTIIGRSKGRAVRLPIIVPLFVLNHPRAPSSHKGFPCEKNPEAGEHKDAGWRHSLEQADVLSLIFP